MDLIRISDSKLKVMLTALDMEKFSLDSDKIDYGNTETRRAFWCILDEAKHRTGFDAAGDRVFIQVYQSRNGGCEMYVTKLSGEFGERENGVRFSLPEERMYYRFERMEDLIGGCVCLKKSGYHGKSVAYCSEEKAGVYYLSISDSPRAMAERLGEFGALAEGRLLPSYIAEHCRALCEKNAVEILSALS